MGKRKQKAVEEFGEVINDQEPLPVSYQRSSEMIAKKYFKILQNEFEKEIFPGDDLSDIPERFLENLKTEGIL